MSGVDHGARVASERREKGQGQDAAGQFSSESVIVIRVHNGFLSLGLRPEQSKFVLYFLRIVWVQCPMRNLDSYIKAKAA